MEGLQRAENPTRSTQQFRRRDADGGGGGATRPSAALAPSAPAAHRLLMRCSRAARSMLRASARSQALEATCVSRKRHQVRGDAEFCAERKIPINIAGIPDIVTRGFREQMPRRPEERLQDRQDTLIE